MAAPIKLLLKSTLDLLYPPHCEFCQKPGRTLCKHCFKRIRRILPPYCQVCSLPVTGRTSQPFICTDCRHRKFHFRFVVCDCSAEDVVRQFIHRFKYQKVTYLSGILSRLLFRAWRDYRVAANPPDILIPVPLHPRRERERGFNQARMLAEALSQYTGVPYGTFLKRILSTQSQTLLSRRQRRQNLRCAFALPQNSLLNGRHVMLVDDVLTTGSTLEECSKTLLAGGVGAVSAITVARA